MTTASAMPPAYRFLRKAIEIGIGPIGASILAVVALAAGGTTYAAVTQLFPTVLPPRSLNLLVWVDVAVVLTLSCLIAIRVASILVARRRGASGSRLHIRLVLLFVLMAVIPTVIVATFSGYTINVSLRDRFTDAVRQTLDDARSVGDRFLAERISQMTKTIVPLGATLKAAGPEVLQYPSRLEELLSASMAQNQLSEVALVDSDGNPIVRGKLPIGPGEFVRPSQAALREAAENSGVPNLLKQQEADRISALLLVYNDPQVFLYVSQRSEPLAQVNRIRSTAEYYNELESRQTEIQLRIAAVFVIIVLVMLLLAIWIGILYAQRLSAPITALIGAAERVRQGDLAVKLNEGATDDELGVLTRAFNRMTVQLGEQRGELVSANNQLDERRRLIEAVLSGVTAAVFSLDDKGNVELANRAAVELFDCSLADLLGTRLADRVPGLTELIEAGRSRPNRVTQDELEFRLHGETRTLLTRVAVEQFEQSQAREEGSLGFVVTFDDVTELVSAQRKAAWADVARRIAHEIKNPLTPIQLSAERLKRKYLRLITEDPETFIVCTDTIIRQVGDIGRMVDEFSSFARMPRPVMQDEDIKEICMQSVFLQRNAQPEIEYVSDMPEGKVPLPCDRRQIGQAITNLMKNASEAIDGRVAPAGQVLERGRIWVRLAATADTVTLAVEDNGKGLPQEHRARLTEPYVTTRAKGTGLGLAIVKKIMEDHGGYLLLEDREGGGARVSLVFKRGRAGVIETTHSDASPSRAKMAQHGA